MFDLALMNLGIKVVPATPKVKVPKRTRIAEKKGYNSLQGIAAINHEREKERKRQMDRFAELIRKNGTMNTLEVAKEAGTPRSSTLKKLTTMYQIGVLNMVKVPNKAIKWSLVNGG